MRHKTFLITNKSLNTEQGYICVSRPRRFGKSMAANMLTAYYSRGYNSKEMFSRLKISEDVNFEKHLHQYNMIHLNIRDFLSGAVSMKGILEEIEKSVLFELKKSFSDVEYYDCTKLSRSLQDVFAEYQIPFVFIIVKWDSIF